MILGEGRDRFAWQHDLTLGNRNAERAPGARGKDGSLAHLLGDHAAVRSHGCERPLRNVHVGRRLIELRLRADAATLQFLDAIEVAPCLVALRLLGLNARVERLHLQDQLLVRDGGELRPGGDPVAFPGLQRGDRAADARTRDKFMNWLDGGDDRLAVGDFRHMNDNPVGGQSVLGGHDEGEKREWEAHRSVSKAGLTYM